MNKEDNSSTKSALNFLKSTFNVSEKFESTTFKNPIELSNSSKTNILNKKADGYVEFSEEFLNTLLSKNFSVYNSELYTEKLAMDTMFLAAKEGESLNSAVSKLADVLYLTKSPLLFQKTFFQLHKIMIINDVELISKGNLLPFDSFEFKSGIVEALFSNETIKNKEIMEEFKNKFINSLGQFYPFSNIVGGMLTKTKQQIKENSDDFGIDRIIIDLTSFSFFDLFKKNKIEFISSNREDYHLTNENTRHWHQKIGSFLGVINPVVSEKEYATNFFFKDLVKETINSIKKNEDGTFDLQDAERFFSTLSAIRMSRNINSNGTVQLKLKDPNRFKMDNDDIVLRNFPTSHAHVELVNNVLITFASELLLREDLTVEVDGKKRLRSDFSKSIAQAISNAAVEESAVWMSKVIPNLSYYDRHPQLRMKGGYGGGDEDVERAITEGAKHSIDGLVLPFIAVDEKMGKEIDLQQSFLEARKILSNRIDEALIIEENKAKALEEQRLAEEETKKQEQNNAFKKRLEDLAKQIDDTAERKSSISISSKIKQ